LNSLTKGTNADLVETQLSDSNPDLDSSISDLNDEVKNKDISPKLRAKRTVHAPDSTNKVKLNLS